MAGNSTLSTLDINKEFVENGFTTDMDQNTDEVIYFCKQCDFKTKHGNGIKSHISKVHKNQGLKRLSNQESDKNDHVDCEADDHNDEKKKKIEIVITGEGDDDVFMSTQASEAKKDEMSADELVNMYESEGYVTDDKAEKENGMDKDKTDGGAVNEKESEKNKTDGVNASNTEQDLALDNSISTLIPDDTYDGIMMEVNQGNEVTDQVEKITGLKADIIVIKDKLKGKDEEITSLKLKVEEAELGVLNANMEISTLTENIHQQKNEIALKNEENDILIAEKNSLETDKSNLETKNKQLEDKLEGYTRTIEKIFKEKSFLKNENNKLNNTIELLQNQAKKTNGTKGNSEVNENIKKLNEKLKEKNKTIEELKDEKKRLANELAVFENTTHSDQASEDKNLKLTNMLKSKTKEHKETVGENNTLKRVNKELQQNLNNANNKTAGQEATITRLQAQVNDLIEICDKNKTTRNVDQDKSVNFEDNNIDKRNQLVQKSKNKMKCRNHDKGLCRFGDKCDFSHTSNQTCIEYSRSGECRNEKNCPNRHPSGVCIHWKRGSCDKKENCKYTNCTR